MKAAYDEARCYHLQDNDSDSDGGRNDSELQVLSDGELQEDLPDLEPHRKKHKPDTQGIELCDRPHVAGAVKTGIGDVLRNQNGGAQSQSNAETKLKTCDRFVVKKNVMSGKIDSALAEKISGYLMNGIDKTEKEITMKNVLFLPPINCPRLDVVLVNQGVFNKADRETRTGDVILQNFQKSLLKGITILAKSMDKFIKAEEGEADPPSIEETKDLLSEALAILGDTSHEIDLRRRVLFRPTIDPALAQALCGDSAPVEGQLFGSNLSQRVTELKDINKVTNSVVKPSTSILGKGHYPNYKRLHSQAAPRYKLKHGTGNPFLGPSYLSPHKKAGYQSNRGKQQVQRYKPKPQYPQKQQKHQWY
ncbi:uncharacterized protein LOC106159264 [Lingula anatina]|uniref:Uncharacterized protein LOC106159264 n=1 Tax=Lingula anatina TaxID=7574 RepID=A0A1S3HY37_LINAN|nr:uncharacterized protein LOC106159264 [Lingula anatina]|eukprot:XP_013390942.1 uncharacterized protein LOC106159264 [Lingula anatina]